MTTINFNNLLKQSELAKTQEQLFREFLEVVKEVGMKDYQLYKVFDSVTLEVPLHEKHLISKLVEKLKATLDDETFKWE